MAHDRDAFVERYGGIYEHSPWVAAECFAAAAKLDAGQSGPAALAGLFAACVDAAPRERKLALIRAHPDLAGKAAIAGELTADSTSEQVSAGIDQCTKEEFDRFQRFNRRYRQKFGFPFVMAVRNSKRGEILAAFEKRLANDAETEFEQAMAEIHKIARLRLEAL